MSKSPRGRWTGWASRKPSILRPFPSLRCEQLESRDVPTTFIWTGAGGAANTGWQNPANWQGNVAPTGAPAEHDILSFPAGLGAGASHTTNNNLLNATIDSIQISDNNYKLTGNSITLGQSGAPSSGSVTVTNTVTGISIGMDLILGVAGGSREVFTVANPGAALTISGHLVGSAGQSVYKEGGGTLTLVTANPGFNGPVVVDTNSGALVVTDPGALGAGTNTVTVLNNSALQLQNVSGTITNPLILNGPGPSNQGALQVLAGTATWAGTVELDSDTTLGASSGAVLTISGQISDTGASHNIIKEGAGEIQFTSPGGNTYRGTTTINGGVLTISSPLALGPGNLPGSVTTVNSTLTEQGQLRLAAPAGSTGFTVLNEQLVLNGAGQSGLSNTGALTNTVGNNQWAGPVTIGSLSPNGSNVQIGAATGTDLTISGLVSDLAGQTFGITKVDAGRVILNNANVNYTGATTVAAGTLDVRDSQALGKSTAAPSVNVFSGATLELEVEDAIPGLSEFDPHGRDLWNDSVTGNPNKLIFTNPLTISGTGVNGVGALYSASGINQWSANIALASGAAAIGVALDSRPGHPSPDASYFTNDYSLTTNNVISGGRNTAFEKVGTGQLILPVANTYTGGTLVQQGWVTVQNNNSLGALIPGLADSQQPRTVVSSGAAVHIKPANPSVPLYFDVNIILSGNGPTLPYALISQKGALVNLAGSNVWGSGAGGVDPGAASIGLLGQAGIGVQQLNPADPVVSELTVTGAVTDGVVTKAFSGSNQPSPNNTKEFSQIIDTTGLSGRVTFDYNVFTLSGNPLPPGFSSDFRVYYGPRSANGQLIYDSGEVTGKGTISADFGPGTGTQIEIVVNQTGTAVGGVTGWTLSPGHVDGVNLGGSLVKLGSQRLTLQGADSYSGSTDVQEGTLRAQNDTALGSSSSGTHLTNESFTQQTTTVETGAVLELKGGVDNLNGGVSAGLQIYNQKLVLNSPGQQISVGGDATGTFTLTYTSPVDSTTQTTAPISVGATAAQVQAALSALTNLIRDVGSVTVIPAGNVFRVIFGAATAPDVPLLTAAMSTGAEVWVSGVTYYNGTGTTVPVDASLVNVSDDNVWRGPVSLTSDARVNVTNNSSLNSRLSLLGAVDDAGNPAQGGSALDKRGGGELVLGGNNTFRGQLYIDQGILTATSSQAFGATTGGTTVSTGAQLQLQGDLNIAGEPLTISGAGWNPASTPSAIPVRWLQVGGAPINNGQVPSGLPVTGRVTGVAVDPTDSSVIYIATAGGGAWKTTDGGKTWHALFDLQSLTPGQLDATLYGGAIAIDPTDPTFIVYGTGEANNSGDSFSGTGVYYSQDSGKTWNLMTSTSGTANPLYGQSISKIVIEPANVYQNNPRYVFVASSDQQVNADPADAVGVWRWDASNTWFDMTGYVSPNRANVTGKAPYANTPPGTPGPDDDYRFKFPQFNTTWSDLAIVYIDTTTALPGTHPVVPVLYAALGDPWGSPYNAVYRTQNPNTSTPLWYIGDPGTPAVADARASNAFAGGPWDTNNNPQFPYRNGRITFTVFAADPDGPTDPNKSNPPAAYLPNWASTTLYAAITVPLNGYATAGQLLQVLKSSDGGRTWAGTAAVPPNYLGTQGWYDTTIVAVDGSTVFVGGASGNNTIMLTQDGGATWTPVSTDGFNHGPHADLHAMILDNRYAASTGFPDNLDFDAQRAGRLLLGTDGGLWRYNIAGQFWEDLNGNLAITTFNGVDVDPTDPNRAFGASQDNGTEEFTGSQAWTHVDDGDGGAIQVDQLNPNNVYHVLNGVLRKSTDGGKTWSNVLNLSGNGLYFPFVLDDVNPQRLVAATSNTVDESLDGGATWISLNFPATIPPTILTSVAIATYQGTFVADPGFPLVSDVGANTYDPKTIYASDGSFVYVTKNAGVSWQRRGAAITGTIQSLTVDPTNRDVVYAVCTDTAGSGLGRVFKSTDGGLTWTNITKNLPDSPTWTLVVDPRTNTLYVGTDLGVYSIANAGAGAAAWATVGAGLPNVEVKTLVLNQTLNTLTAGTYGRSMFQLFLDYATPNSGVVRELSGASVWTGPVTLAGNTTLNADGSQQATFQQSQNGVTGAQLNIVGTIGDGGNNYTITKIGNGTITLSGANTYGGQTLVQSGVLQSNNATALGASGNANPNVDDTIVYAGAALELLTDLEGEPITLNGNGFQFNGHSTGALLNVGFNDTYTGTLTLATNTTIGVNSGTTLTIGQSPILTGAGTITDAGNDLSFDKELPGTLVLADADTYGGLTRVVQGALQVQNANALGTRPAGSTKPYDGATQVLDGAQLQIARNATTLLPTVIASEPLYLSGTGIFGTGALLNVRGDSNPTGTNDNAWNGPITFTSLPNFSPATTPGTIVTLGSSDARDTLTIGTPVVDDPNTGQSYLLQKVGAGRVTLAAATAVTGGVDVAQGYLRIEDPLSLGRLTLPQVQTVTIGGTAGTYKLRYSGQATVTLNATDSAATVQAALESLPGIGIGNVFVGETPVVNSGVVTGEILTVLFKGALANTTPAVLQTTQVSVPGGVTVAIAPAGTVMATTVETGATLELDNSLVSPAGQPLVVNQQVTLNGDGVNRVGALDNAVGNNTYAGPIILATDASIGAEAGTALTVTGLIQDPAVVPVPAARLRKAGAGTVVLPAANAYGGATVVDNGVLQILTPAALGAVRSETQSVTVIGTNGTFALSFGGYTTAALPFNADATAVTNALNALPSIGGVGGSVTVVETNPPGSNVFAVTFGGTLADENVAQIVPVYVPAAVTRTQAGNAGTGTSEVQTAEVIGSGGAFALTFNGATTAALAYNASAFDVATALNALPTIGGAGGSVTVTQSGALGDYTYTVTFGGSLANLPQSLMTSAVVGGTLVTATTTVDGKEGTVVNDGGTLQVKGSLTFSGQSVTLNGEGFNNLGALNELGGNLVWGLPPLILGSDASIGTSGATDTISFPNPISDLGGKFALDIYGPGTVTYSGTGTVTTAGTTYTQYGGLTTLHEGTLLLNYPGGNSILGGLVVGDGLPGSTPAVARELFGDQIADAAPLTVNANGTFDLNSLSDTVGKLTVNDGTVELGTPGQLTTGKVVMTGGLIDVGAGGALTSGDVSMSASTAGGAKIQFADPGTFQAGNLTMDGSSISFAGAGSFAVGNVTMTNGSTIALPAGTGNTTLDITMTGGSITVPDSSTLAAGNVTDNGGAITLGNNDTLTAQAVTVGTSGALVGTLTFGTNGQLTTTGNLTVTGGQVTLGTPGTIQTQSVVLTGGSITLGDNSSLTAAGTVTNAGGTVTLGNNGQLSAAGVGETAGGVIAFGTGGRLTTSAGGLTLDASQLTFLSGGTVTTQAVSLTTGSTVSFADHGTLTTTGGLTLGGASTLAFGAFGAASVGADVNMTGSSGITFGDNGLMSVTGNINETGGAITFTDVTTTGTFGLTAKTVTLKSGAVITMGIGQSLTTTGNLLLTGSAVRLGRKGKISTANVTMLSASTLQLGDLGTLSAGVVSDTGGTITFGNGDQVTTGAFSDTGGTVSFGTGDQVTTADLTFTADTVTVGDNTSLTANGNLTVTGAVTLGNADTLTVKGTTGATVKSGGSVAFGTGGQLTTTTGGLSLDRGQLTFQSGGTVTTRAVSLINGSTVGFADHGTLTATGALTMSGGSTLTFGAFGSAAVQGVSLTGGGIALGDNSTLSTGAVADAGGSIVLGNVTAGNTGGFAAGGPVTVTSGSVTLGTGQTFSVAGDLAFTGSPLTVGDNSSVTVAGTLTDSGGAATLGNTDTVSATAVSVQSGGSVAFGTGGQLTTTGGGLSLDASQLTFQSGGAVSTQAVNLTTGSTVSFADHGTLAAAGDVTLGGASNLSLGDNSSLTASGNLTETGGTVALGNFDTLMANAVALANAAAATFGTNGQLTTTGGLTVDDSQLTFLSSGTVSTQAVSLTNGSTVSFADNGKLTGTGALTLGGASTLKFGPSGTATALSVSLTGGGITFGDDSSLTASGGLTDNGGAVTFGNTGTLKAGSVSATNSGSVAFKTGGQLTTTSTGLSLDKSQLTFLGSGAVSTQAVSLTTGAKVSFTTSGTLTGAGALTMSGGSTLTFGASGAATVQGVTLTGGGISLGDNSTLSTGAVTDAGGSITLGNVTAGNTGGFAAGGPVAVTSGSVTLGTGQTFSVAGDLALTGSPLAIGAGGTGSVQNVALTASTISLGAGTTLTVGGNLTAASTAAAATAVTGAGTLNLGGATPTVAVTHGATTAGPDLTISTQLTAGAGVSVLKSGSGLLDLAPPGGFGGGVNATGGEVEVDTAVGPVQLSGGATLSGNGTVGALTGPSAGPVVGTVSPGISYTPAQTVGILTSGPATWGASTVFAVNLSHTSAGAPQPGVDYDQLVVNGNLDLGNATLAGIVGGGIKANDQFTIIQLTSGTITNKFQQTNGQDIVFIAGQKFGIVYAPTSVTLEKIPADATIALAASPNPSTLGQAVTLTATVTPEAGATLTTGLTVTFFVDGNPIGSPQTVTGGVATLVTIALPGGTHTLSATFNGDGTTFNSASTPVPGVSQTVVTPTIDPLTGVPAAPAYITNYANSTGARTFTVTTAVKQEAFGTNWELEVYRHTPGGTPATETLVRHLTGTATSAGSVAAITASWDGTNDSLVPVADGTYDVTVTFTDQFNNTGVTAPVQVTVVDNPPTATTPTVSAPVIAPGTAQTVPATTTVTALVGEPPADDPALLDHWTVTVSNGATTIVTSPAGTGTTASYVWNGRNASGAVVPDGTYTVTVTAYDKAGNFFTSASQTVQVLTQLPTVTLATSGSAVYGQTVTLTATVAPPSSAPAGLAAQFVGTTVQFYAGATDLGGATIALNSANGKYQAVLQVPKQLAAGTYSNLAAVFTGSPTFLPATSAPAALTITPAPLTVTVIGATSVYGSPVPALGYTAQGLAAGDTVQSVFTGALATTAAATSSVGSYPIGRGTLAVNTNYTIATFTSAAYQITPAPLTVVVDNLNRQVGTPNPTLTFSVQGLKNNDPASVVTGLTLTTTATDTSPLGRYPVTASGTPTAGPNYTVVSIVPGSLTVTPTLTTIAVGSGGGGDPTGQSTISIYSPTGQLLDSVVPFPGFTGEVRTVQADFNHDGVLDIAAVTGPGVPVEVKVLDGVTGSTLFDATPFDGFTGGGFVSAGDLTGDGIPDLVVTPDQGGGPRVLGYSGTDFSQLFSFFGINDPAFRGGARAAIGDLNKDGYGDLVVSAGFQGGPRISIWDGKGLANGQYVNVVPDFFAFEPTLRNGAYVAVGDVNNDGYADLVFGAGPGGGPRVLVVDGNKLLTQGAVAAVNSPMANFFAGNTANRAGVRVTTKTLTSSPDNDVVTGDATGSVVTAYRGSSLAEGQTDVLFTLDAFPGLNNGVFVG